MHQKAFNHSPEFADVVSPPWIAGVVLAPRRAYSDPLAPRVVEMPSSGTESLQMNCAGNLLVAVVGIDLVTLIVPATSKVGLCCHKRFRRFKPKIDDRCFVIASGGSEPTRYRRRHRGEIERCHPRFAGKRVEDDCGPYRSQRLPPPTRTTMAVLVTFSSQLRGSPGRSLAERRQAVQRQLRSFLRRNAVFWVTIDCAAIRPPRRPRPGQVTVESSCRADPDIASGSVSSRCTSPAICDEDKLRCPDCAKVRASRACGSGAHVASASAAA